MKIGTLSEFNVILSILDAQYSLFYGSSQLIVVIFDTKDSLECVSDMLQMILDLTMGIFDDIRGFLQF